MRYLLAVRAILFVVLIPGTVTTYVPYRLLRSAVGRVPRVQFSIAGAAAALLIVAGGAVLLSSVWQFFADGRGTLAPVDPPRKLVVTGLYRVTRNPMYNGVLAILFGEAWFFRSAVLLQYAAIMLVVFHLVVVLYEERILEARFEEKYNTYRKNVPRWGFTVHPYAAQPGSTAQRI